MQFKYAESPVVRQRALEGFESRLSINVDLLDKALEFRREIAKLLKYNTWADYVTEVKMIKSGDGIKQVCCPFFHICHMASAIPLVPG